MVTHREEKVTEKKTPGTSRANWEGTTGKNGLTLLQGNHYEYCGEPIIKPRADAAAGSARRDVALDSSQLLRGVAGGCRDQAGGGHRDAVIVGQCGV